MIDIKTIAIFSLGLGACCCLVLSIDVLRHPQRMGVMNIVWPVTALYAGPLGLLAYYTIGRRPASRTIPFWQSVLKGSLHCGGGCTLGDLAAEVFLLFVPVTIAGSALLGGWTVDFAFAFAIGILFQYYAIRPMKQMSLSKAIIAALKADALSLSFWQIGMYGWMAICFFVIFRHPLKASDPVFWFMMQLAMLVGLCTAFPVNWWLLKKGIKEAM
ncbi:MAG TPA: DUF4396 domain-containing protein [Puia sp.]|jgi:hypothetical protein